MAFFGIYQASTTAQTGCVKSFCTTERSYPAFPPSVMYTCDLCHSDHAFRFVRSMTVDTPSAARQFDVYCTGHSIEKDVAVPEKK